MNQQIGDAINTVNRLIPLAEQAERQFRGARNLGIWDILGGGTLVDLAKHYKLGKASDIMEQVNVLLQKLSAQLGNISIPVDYRMKMNGALTFADFFFDGIFVDAYMASKIMQSLEQIRDLKRRLFELKNRLEQMD